MKAVTATEMRSIEEAAVREGISLQALMERAGRAVARAADTRATGSVLVLCGPGNNGNDGLIAAQTLARSGRDVTAYGFGRSEWRDFAGRHVRAEEDPEFRELDQLVQGASVIMDALLGIGSSREPQGALAAILDRVDSKRGAWKLAVDVPTGVDADTGVAAAHAFRADQTVCIGFLKRGLALFPGAEYAGEVEVVDVGLSPQFAAAVKVSVPTIAEIAAYLPARRMDGNKGTYGHVLFVGGSNNFAGAPALAAEAAYRAGSGLVEVASPRSVVPLVAGHLREAIFRPLPEIAGSLALAAIPVVCDAMQRANSLIVGPGLGSAETVTTVVREVLSEAARLRRKSLVDADGLNALARIPQWWEGLANPVLTPHPGEMSRLTGRSIGEIQRNRVECALEFAAKWGATVVLKGAGTVVATPDGFASINPTGSPNLATAGTGDVLSGVIGSLLGQGASPQQAAIAGVYIHGLAGQIAAADLSDAGMLAGDLLPRIPLARRTITESTEESA